MSRRKSLDDDLRSLLGTNYVYFQPPASVRMSYPCFRYSLSNMYSKRADNRNYLNRDRYTIIYITKDPDDDMPHKVLEKLQMCNYDRNYNADGLYHHVFSVYK